MSPRIVFLLLALTALAACAEVQFNAKERLSDRVPARSFAAIARGFGLEGKTVKNLGELPKLVSDLAASRGAAVWDFHVSDKVVSPTIRRAHPSKDKKR